MKIQKTILTFAITALCVLWGTYSFAACSGIEVKIPTSIPNEESPLRMKDVFDNLLEPANNPDLVAQGITSFFSAEDGKYHVCFTYDSDEPEKPDEQVLLSIPEHISQDVVIEGLRLNAGSLSANTAVLLVVNNGSGKLIIKDAIVNSSAKGMDGFKVNRSGPLAGLVEFDDVEFTGASEDKPFNTCLDIEADNSVVKKSSFKYCTDGLMVRAAGIQIEDSIFDACAYGVHVAVGARPVFVKRVSFLFGPDQQSRWIKFDDTTARELELKKYMDGGVKQVFAVTPELPVPGSRIEFLANSGALCGEGTPCNYFENSTFLITGDIVAAASSTFKIMDDKAALAMVGIYTSPTLGSTVASNLIDSKSGVVAFVQTPYDIPTSPESGGVEVESGGNSADGGGISAAGGCKMSISSVTRSTIFFTPWWIILMLAAMVPARTVVRVKKTND